MKASELPLMIVDDDLIDRRTIERSLREAGFEAPVVEARSGVEALELLEDLRHGGSAHVELPGLILLDINMPRMNGIEVLAELKRRPRLSGIPAMVLTTSCQPSDLAQCYENGAAGYFVKPADLTSLRRLIQVIVSFLRVNERPN